jgi:hypothetical protein
MVSSTSKDICGSQRRLVIILGGRKTNAIERKMMERVDYFSFNFLGVSRDCFDVCRVFGGEGGGVVRLGNVFVLQ